MICKGCKYEHFEPHNGNPNRYYCIHPVAAESVNAGARMISRTERHSTERKHKTAPKWCPLKQKCRICGCTWDHACPGGCYWVEPDLCSSCAGGKN